MRDFNKIVFTPQTLVLIVSLAVNNVIIIQTLKSDIRNILTEKKYEIELLQYQIDELKNKGETKRIALNERHAILPNKTEIKDDE
jgi:hypothetical protein